MADSLQASSKGEVISKLRSAQGRIRKLKTAGESAVNVVFQSVTISAAAAVTGYFRGRMGTNGEWKIKKIPVELLLAGAAHVAGAVMSSKVSSALHNVGDGPLAFWTGMKGYQYGLEYAKKNPKSATAGRRMMPPGMQGNNGARASQPQHAAGWR